MSETESQVLNGKPQTEDVHENSDGAEVAQEIVDIFQGNRGLFLVLLNGILSEGGNEDLWNMSNRGQFSPEKQLALSKKLDEKLSELKYELLSRFKPIQKAVSLLVEIRRLHKKALADNPEQTLNTPFLSKLKRDDGYGLWSAFYQLCKKDEMIRSYGGPQAIIALTNSLLNDTIELDIREEVIYNKDSAVDLMVQIWDAFLEKNGAKTKKPLTPSFIRGYCVRSNLGRRTFPGRDLLKQCNSGKNKELSDINGLKGVLTLTKKLRPNIKYEARPTYIISFNEAVEFVIEAWTEYLNEKKLGEITKSKVRSKSVRQVIREHQKGIIKGVNLLNQYGEQKEGGGGLQLSDVINEARRRECNIPLPSQRRGKLSPDDIESAIYMNLVEYLHLGDFDRRFSTKSLDNYPDQYGRSIGSIIVTPSYITPKSGSIKEAGGTDGMFLGAISHLYAEGEIESEELFIKIVKGWLKRKRPQKLTRDLVGVEGHEDMVNFINNSGILDGISEYSGISATRVNMTSKHNCYILTVERGYKGISEFLDDKDRAKLKSANSGFTQHKLFLKFLKQSSDASAERFKTKALKDVAGNIGGFAFDKELEINYRLHNFTSDSKKQKLLVSRFLEGDTLKDILPKSWINDRMYYMFVVSKVIKKIAELHMIDQNKISKAFDQAEEKRPEVSYDVFLRKGKIKGRFSPNFVEFTSRIAKSIKDRGNMRYIHGDLHGDNIWISGYKTAVREKNIDKLKNSAKVRFIDFETLGFGNVLSDIEPILLGLEDGDAVELIRKYWSYFELERSEKKINEDLQKIKEIRFVRIFRHMVNQAIDLEYYTKRIQKQVSRIRKQKQQNRPTKKKEIGNVQLDLEELLATGAKLRNLKHLVISLIEDSNMKDHYSQALRQEIEDVNLYANEINEVFDYDQIISDIEVECQLLIPTYFVTKDKRMLKFGSIPERVVGVCLESILSRSGDEFLLINDKTFQRKGKGRVTFDFYIPGNWTETGRPVIIEYHPLYQERRVEDNELKNDIQLRENYLKKKREASEGEDIILLESYPFDINELYEKSKGIIKDVDSESCQRAFESSVHEINEFESEVQVDSGTELLTPGQTPSYVDINVTVG